MTFAREYIVSTLDIEGVGPSGAVLRFWDLITANLITAGALHFPGESAVDVPIVSPVVWLCPCGVSDVPHDGHPAIHSAEAVVATENLLVVALVHLDDDNLWVLDNWVVHAPAVPIDGLMSDLCECQNILRYSELPWFVKGYAFTRSKAEYVLLSTREATRPEKNSEVQFSKVF